MGHPTVPCQSHPYLGNGQVCRTLFLGLENEGRL
ncbi:hypothetical protein V6Z11_D04G149000 [Gossypium hirsutum]